jgi:outer membrane protein OmpA-like peptidoglycan-associated protein
MNALVGLGIDAGRLEAHGFGETRPIQEGTSRAARAANRRVEFRILDPAPQPGSETPVQAVPPTP